MSNYDDDQSEDGELARSPIVHEDLDFSLSEDEHDVGDSLDIKPPQLTIRPVQTHRSRKSHRRSKDDRHKDSSRRDKKHLYRDRDKEKSKSELEYKHNERDAVHNKEHYRDKSRDYYRDKNQFREKDAFREKESYRESKDVHKEKEAYRGLDQYREKDFARSRDYRDKESYKDKEIHRDNTSVKERDVRHTIVDPDRRHRHNRVMDIKEHRARHHSDDINIRHVEKENHERLTGDKELEDLRSRLLSKRRNQQHQHDVSRRKDVEIVDSSDKDSAKTFKVPELDKTQHERRERLLEAEREMARRKENSKLELEARRERRRGNKRAAPSPPPESRRLRLTVSPPPQPPSPALQRDPISQGETVVVSDNSDVDMKSEHSHRTVASDHSGSASSTSSSSASDSGDATASGSEEEEGERQDSDDGDGDVNSPRNDRGSSYDSQRDRRSRSHSQHTGSDKSVTPRDNRSRSRSHSFSPPPKEENGGNSSINEASAQETSIKPSSPQGDDSRNNLPPYFPALQGCRSVEEFQCLNRIEEGTYGVVYRARDKTTEEIVALKRLKMEKEKEGFPITSLREINTLLKGQHPNIVTVREIVVGSNMDKIFIVMDYVEHDLKSLMEMMRQRKQAFLAGEVKCLMQQLLKAVHHLHDNWILHRDLKTSNLLLSHKGILKVGDFGLAREYGSPLRNYTPIVVTLWYRAPELLLCSKNYSTPIDMWSVGCIFAEFVMMNALFPGKSEVDQLNRIFKELGTPTERVWPGWNELPAVQKMTFTMYAGGGLKTRAGPELLSDAGHSLLSGLLTYNPVNRLTADVALQQSYFTEQPLPIDPAMFPTWPAKSEGGRRAAGAPHSPKPPSGGGQYKMLSEGDPLLSVSAPAHGFRISALTAGGGFSLKF